MLQVFVQRGRCDRKHSDGLLLRLFPNFIEVCPSRKRKKRVLFFQRVEPYMKGGKRVWGKSLFLEE